MLKRNGFGISVDTLPGKKKPQLFIYSEEANVLAPVATFNSQKSADDFMLLLVDGMLDGMIDGTDDGKCPFYQGVCMLDERKVCYASKKGCNVFKKHIHDIIKEAFK